MAASHTIVIAGGGFGGACCAQALEKKLKGLPSEIYLLNPTNYFVFSPLLMEAGTGSLQARHAAVSIRSFLKKTHFKMAQVTSIDLQDQEISCQLVGDRRFHRIRYDHLVMAIGSMTKRGIHIHYNESVSEITANTVTLTGGTTLPSHTLIWCAGVATNPLAENIDLPMDKRGYVLCENDLRVQDKENIWAIGDCAVNRAPDDTPYPTTAQHAIGQGLHLARNISRILRRQEPLPCRLINKGTLAPLGYRIGVAKVFGIKFSGFIAWWLWRTVYPLKMPGWGRKFRIALDGALDLFTRRDVVQLSLHTPERETQ